MIIFIVLNIFILILINTGLISDWKSRCNNNDTKDVNIMVCTDYILQECNVRNVQNIIHYSLPSKPENFNRRYLASVEYYQNKLIHNGDVSAAFSLMIFFFCAEE